MRIEENEGVECFIAKTEPDRQQVYRLRHDCYSRGGAIESRSDRRFSDRFDGADNSFSYLARSNSSTALATVRISVVRPDVGWTDSPGGAVFGDHAAYLEVARESFVEASRLCFASQARRDVLMRLLGNMAAMADYYATEWLVACPRVEHAQMYERLFGFRPMAEPRQYFGVRFETQMLAVRREELREWVRGMRPMMSGWAAGLQYLNSFEWPGGSGGSEPLSN